MGSRVNIIVPYNGVWEQKAEKWNFKASLNTIIHVPIDVSYIKLLEKLYSKLKVDRSLFDLKLEVSFTCNDFSVDLIEITDDEGVSVLILENSKSLKHRVPLCVNYIAKNIALIDQSPRSSVNMENHNQSCMAVPQTTSAPSVCMGGPSHNETFFPQQISRMMMGMSVSLMSMTIQLPILVMMIKELRSAVVLMITQRIGCLCYMWFK
ncbi:uncharacterized protein LOC133807180 [Humulus lupulus]|uniref:uncharacterized protein LOC133807180 n=1 Tax=Humulus lupulus TaxID=3486 RepID=UPI002B40E720|nr:uncharacterized protein LOC133807180 [Humulus lupulus]